jgi:hypothetical protein
VTVVAAGVRNTQRLTVGAREGEAWLDFVDMGGSVAEEFNSIRVVDLLRAGPIRNFGWGRNAADGKTAKARSTLAQTAWRRRPWPLMSRPLCRLWRKSAARRQKRLAHRDREQFDIVPPSLGTLRRFGRVDCCLRRLAPGPIGDRTCSASRSLALTRSRSHCCNSRRANRADPRLFSFS